MLLFPSFVIYLITMVGETNRLPFDLPEGEGELVGGFHTEYASLKFALFYLAEYINMTTVAGLATTLFLGGWRAPWPISVWSGANSGWYPIIWFLIKVGILLFCFIWLRGTLPRIRYDQLMRFGWKVLIPVSLVWILVIATIRVWRTHGGSPARVHRGRPAAGRPARRCCSWRTPLCSAARRRPPRRPRPTSRGGGQRRWPRRTTRSAFPVPPLDLPHYHGIGVTVSTEHGTPESANGTTKEVTGA